MHYQNQSHAEMKLIRCLRCKAWDVAVDLGHGSATFLQWHVHELSSKLQNVFVDLGFAPLFNKRLS